MTEIVEIEGQAVELATITVGALEEIELGGKAGRKFNIALVAASILSTGDFERGTEEWVKKQPVFAPDGGVPSFQALITAANKVNGFKPAQPGEAEPAAPAAG